MTRKVSSFHHNSISTICLRCKLLFMFISVIIQLSWDCFSITPTFLGQVLFRSKWTLPYLIGRFPFYAIFSRFLTFQELHREIYSKSGYQWNGSESKYQSVYSLPLYWNVIRRNVAKPGSIRLLMHLMSYVWFLRLDEVHRPLGHFLDSEITFSSKPWSSTKVTGSLTSYVLHWSEIACNAETDWRPLLCESWKSHVIFSGDLWTDLVLWIPHYYSTPICSAINNLHAACSASIIKESSDDP